MAAHAKLQYLKEVKDYFGTEESKYCEFLRIFWEFTRKVDGDTIVGRVKILFNGDERLVMGFYRLLLDTKRKPTMARPVDEFSNAFESARQMMKNNGKSHSDSSDPVLEIERAEVDMGLMEDIDMTGCGKSKKCSGSRKLVSMQHIGDISMDLNFDESKKSTRPKRKRDNIEERHNKEPSSIPRNETSPKGSSSSTKEVSSHKKKKSEYEVKSFILEDDMFEADMLLSSVTQTAKKLVGKINRMPGGKVEINKVLRGQENIHGTFDGEEIREEWPGNKELTIANLICVERFYSDTRIDIQLALIRENPVELVDIVSNLLRWKEDLETSRVGLHEIAREAFARNTILMHKTAGGST